MSNDRSSIKLSNDTNFAKIRHPSKKLWPLKVVGGAYVNIGDSIGGAYVNIGDSIGSTYAKVSGDLNTPFWGQNGPFPPLLTPKT